MGPCAKTVVTATLLLPTGQRFVGRNDCRSPQPICPRSTASARDDYVLCTLVCDQPQHAEAAAILKAMSARPFAEELPKGGHMHIEHHRVCDACQHLMRSFAITWSLGPPPEPTP